MSYLKQDDTNYVYISTLLHSSLVFLYYGIERISLINFHQVSFYTSTFHKIYIVNINTHLDYDDMISRLISVRYLGFHTIQALHELIYGMIHDISQKTKTHACSKCFVQVMYSDFVSTDVVQYLFITIQ